MFRHYTSRVFKLEWIGVIVSAILFSILHISNNDITSYLVYLLLY
ncbi:hypothetical protein [Leuconostoc lactis]